MHNHQTPESESFEPHHGQPDSSLKVDRVEAVELIQSWFAPIAILTTDPVIEALADCRSQWRQHPDVTTSVTTAQVGEPKPPPLSCLEMIFPDEIPRALEPSGETSVTEHEPIGSEGHADDRRPRPGGNDSVGEWNEQAARLIDRSNRPRVVRRRQRPSRLKDLLLVAGIALICGAIGAAGYLYFSRPRVTKPSPSS